MPKQDAQKFSILKFWHFSRKNLSYILLQSQLSIENVKLVITLRSFYSPKIKMWFPNLNQTSNVSNFMKNEIRKSPSLWVSVPTSFLFAAAESKTTWQLTTRVFIWFIFILWNVFENIEIFNNNPKLTFKLNCVTNCHKKQRKLFNF